MLARSLSNLMLGVLIGVLLWGMYLMVKVNSPPQRVLVVPVVPTAVQPSMPQPKTKEVPKWSA